MAEAVFDQGKVADLATRINDAIAELKDLSAKRREAADACSSAECRLANLRIEFTRAVDGHLDMSTLKQQRPSAAERV